MKNRKDLYKNVTIGLLTIIIFSIIFIIIDIAEYNNYKENANYKISAILEIVKEKYPDVNEKELIDILNAETTTENSLAQYGYDIKDDSFIKQNDSDNIIYLAGKIIIFIISFIVLMYFFIRYNLKNDKEIDKIIKCIEDINHKNYELKLDDISENKLSILKQEIYKTTIMLKENAENSLKDKINLKKSLQDISHQLKTPLTSINIMLDNIIDDTEMETEVRQNFIKQIKREITNITFLVQSILKLSKFEANTIEFIKKEVSIELILKETIKNVSNLSDLKNVNIKIENKCSRKIKCDYKWQVEALTNIIKNSIEYSGSGKDVVINCEDNNLYTQIKIIDFGKGMDQEELSNIFKRFYKGKNAGKDSIGIGMSLAKAIIEEDNGTITIESEKEKGTTIIIKYFE